jgi:hypothetical protein
MLRKNRFMIVDRHAAGALLAIAANASCMRPATQHQAVRSSDRLASVNESLNRYRLSRCQP